MSFKFNTNQNIYTVGKAKVGGQPGETTNFSDRFYLLARPKNGSKMPTKAFSMQK